MGPNVDEIYFHDNEKFLIHFVSKNNPKSSKMDKWLHAYRFFMSKYSCDVNWLLREYFCIFFDIFLCSISIVTSLKGFPSFNEMSRFMDYFWHDWKDSRILEKFQIPPMFADEHIRRILFLGYFPCGSVKCHLQWKWVNHFYRMFVWKVPTVLRGIR